jgi:phospholipid-translocating ATPase
MGQTHHAALFSSQEKDITPDPKLLEKVSECDRFLAIARHQEHPLAHLSPELSDVFDFFIALTICNTVVVTSPDQPRQKASSAKAMRPQSALDTLFIVIAD